MFRKLFTKLKDSLGFVGSILVFLISLVVYCAPLMVLPIPSWLTFVLLFVIEFSGELADLITIPLWIWALFVALQHPTFPTHIVFFVLFVVFFIPNLISVISKLRRRR